MAKRFHSNYIPIRSIKPGGEFTHYQELYRRATSEEEPRHSGRELAAKRGPGKVILAYQLKHKGGGKTPVSFNAEVKVVIRRERPNADKSQSGRAKSNHRPISTTG